MTTLASLVPYQRGRPGRQADETFGWIVAHQDIVEAAATQGVVDDVLLFTPAGQDAPPSKRAIRLLSDAASCPVVSRPLEELASVVARRSDVVVLCKTSEFSTLAGVREMLDGARFSLCAITHAVPHPHMLDNMVMAALLGRPHDAIVATSSAAARAVRGLLDTARGLLGEASRIDTSALVQEVPLAVPDHAWTTAISRADARRCLELSESDVVLLSLGRVAKSYKADLFPLVHALHHLRAGNPRLRLLIAGRAQSDAYVAELERAITSLELDSRVTFHLDVPGFARAVLYSAADIFVAPNDNLQESFGLAVVEAMAAGLPVVASDWSGHRDLIEHGRTGMLVPTLMVADRGTAVSLGADGRVQSTEGYVATRTVVAVDALAASLKVLADDAERRHSMGRLARERAERCRASTVIGQYAGLWHAMTQQAAVAPPTQSRLPAITDLCAHYATESLAPSMTLASISPLGDEALGDPPQPATLPAGVSYATAERIFAAAGTPVSLATLEHLADVPLAQVVALAKSGHLTLATHGGLGRSQTLSET